VQSAIRIYKPLKWSVGERGNKPFMDSPLLLVCADCLAVDLRRDMLRGGVTECSLAVDLRRDMLRGGVTECSLAVDLRRDMFRGGVIECFLAVDLRRDMFRGGVTECSLAVDLRRDMLSGGVTECSRDRRRLGACLTTDKNIRTLVFRFFKNKMKDAKYIISSCSGPTLYNVLPQSTADISDNFEWISTKFSEICLLTKRRALSDLKKIVTFSWGNPTTTSALIGYTYNMYNIWLNVILICG